MHMILCGLPRLFERLFPNYDARLLDLSRTAILGRRVEDNFAAPSNSVYYTSQKHR